MNPHLARVIIHGNVFDWLFAGLIVLGILFWLSKKK